MSVRVFAKYLLKTNRNFYVTSRLFSNSPKVVLKSFDTMPTETTYTYDEAVIKGRKPDYPIHPLLLSRTSPREMTGEDLSDKVLMTLFEAARWAPSFYNQQPWRFLYAKRNTEHWDKFHDLVWPLNLQWCEPASALVVVVSHRLFFMKGDNTKELPNPTHSFDTGAACMALALEASARDLVVHCMAGFDYEKAYEVFGVDKARDSIDCMIAIGKRPALSDRSTETRIAPRHPVDRFVFEGGFEVNNNVEKTANNEN